MSRLITCAMALVATSFSLACGTSSSPPAVTDVYAAGYISKDPSGGTAPAYWKNGVPGGLMGSGSGQAAAIFISGTDIYVAGTDSNSGPVY